MARTPAEVRRQQFVDAAVKVISREGAERATTRRIAEEAQAPLATLHYCFQTKENLLWAVFEQLAELVRTDIERATAAEEGVGVLVGHILRETSRWGLSHREYNRAQIEIWLWAQRNDEVFAKQIYDMFIKSWKEYLQRARSPLDDERLESITRLVVAVVDGLAMQFITEGDARAIMREVETAVAMLDTYVLSAERPATAPK